MSCYLCAYRKSAKPSQPQPLPGGSPAQPNDELGTCSRCKVLACSEHGTRYAEFECAMCSGAIAVQHALSTQPEASASASAAAALARQIGGRASRGQVDRMRGALQRIRRDQQTVVSAGQERALAAGRRDPNLVSDLAGFVRSRSRSPRIQEGFVPMVRVGREVEIGSISLEAIAAVVREAFATSAIVEPNEEVARVALGAYFQALEIADQSEESRALRADDLPPPVDGPPPWEVSYPVLLDPVMWLIAAAYEATG